MAGGLASDDLLLQPFLPLVAVLGEVCLVFVAGRFSHMVHKDPRLWRTHGSSRTPNTESIPTPPLAPLRVWAENAPVPVRDAAEAVLGGLSAERRAECEEAFALQPLCCRKPTEAMLRVAGAALDYLIAAIQGQDRRDEDAAAAEAHEAQETGCAPLMARFDLLPSLEGLDGTEGTPEALEGVQGLQDPRISWVLSEVECFGPELFLRTYPPAAHEIAKALRDLLAMKRQP